VNVFGGIEPGVGETLLATVRHGLTELNRDKRVGGRVDVPLIDEGRRQAEQARDAFAGTGFDVVVTSPLARAIETAEIVTGWPRSRFVVDEGCTERSFGEMEGLHPWEVRERYPEVRYLTIDHIGYSLNPPGGESFEELHERAAAFLARTIERFRGSRVLVFSHQNFMQQLHGAIRGHDAIGSLKIDLLNCELNAFRLGPSGEPIDERSVLLVPSAGDHPSF
jgi:broad specificity phosphatase PhoE